MGFSFSSIFSGNPLKKVLGISNKVIGEGVAGVVGRDSWLGRRAVAYSRDDNPWRAIGANIMGGIQQYQGWQQAEKTVAAEDSAAASASADAAAKQTEFEASARAGLERLALRRRRGFGASMIVDPGSSLGTTSTLGV